MRGPYYWLSTLGGLGHFPAPGTWGTVATLPLAYAMLMLPSWAYAACTLAIVWVSVLVCDRASRQYFQDQDAGAIILDEVAGTLVGAMVLYAAGVSVVSLAVYAVLFRFFDILKPFPIRSLEQGLKGGLGIVMDDVVAGAMAGLCLLILSMFFTL